MAMEGYREAAIHECCANCKNLRDFGLRSYACRLDEKTKNGTKRVPDVLYDEDNEDYTNMYYYVCDSFGLHDRFK